MSTPLVTRPTSEICDPAPTPPAILLAQLARRARVSLPHAAVIAHLAGLGPQDVR